MNNEIDCTTEQQYRHLFKFPHINTASYIIRQCFSWSITFIVIVIQCQGSCAFFWLCFAFSELVNHPFNPSSLVVPPLLCLEAWTTSTCLPTGVASACLPLTQLLTLSPFIALALVTKAVDSLLLLLHPPHLSNPCHPAPILTYPCPRLRHTQ